MKKKWLTTVVTALCLALVASLFTACGKKQVKIELSQTTLELIVGEGATLVATTSNGKDVEWSTSDANVATVSSRGGVTAQGAGTCTITAKYGKASATCAVTVKEKIVVNFTFTDGSGATLTEATVDRDGTLQLNATASDDSEITSWESQDESIATVSPTGLVRGLFDGDTNIVVKTATGQGVIKVTVVDNFQGEKYAITDTKTAGKWYYHINGDGGRTHELTRSEYRGGVVTFGYTGSCNWSIGDVSLAIGGDSSVTEGWHTLKAKIKASTEMNVSVNGTAVKLVEGDNDIEVAYEQIVGKDCLVIVFAVGVNDATVVVSDYEWSSFTPVTLATPTFTRDGNAIAISTTDTKGIAAYQIGLFKAGESTPVFTQNFAGASGTLDTSDCEEDGTFIIRVRTVGNPGYTSSEWSTGDAETVVVANGGLTYDLISGGESSSLASGKWEYWTQGAAPSVAEYKNGTVTYKTTYLGWDWYGTQLFRHYSDFATGDNVKISMKVKASHAGSITVCGTPFAITAGDNNIVAYKAQAEGSATIGMQFAVQGGGEGTEYPNFPAGTEDAPIELTFAISNIKVETFEPIKLAGSTIAVDADNAFTITDADNAGKIVDGYKIEIFNGENKVVKTQTVTTQTGDLDVADIGAGSFTAKVTTLGHGMYVTSDASAACDAFTVTKLAVPSISVDTSNEYAYTITDTNDAEFVKSYIISVGNKKFEVTSKTGKLDISTISTGTYDVKVKVVASKKYASAESAAISVEIENANAGYTIVTNAGDGWENTNVDTWGAWADQNWCGSNVAVTSAAYSNGTVTLTFTSTGACAFGLQLKYKNSDYAAGTSYSFDIVSTSDMAIQVGNGSADVTNLTAGASQHLTGTESANFYLQVNIAGNVSGTITISNVVWA